MAVAENRSQGLTVQALLALLDERDDVAPSEWRFAAEGAAFALVGAGVREAEPALRRYATMRSVDGSWRATRWAELPGLLSLALPERISALWSRFPFEARALCIADPTAAEMEDVFSIVSSHIAQEERYIPTGSACLLACASMAKERGVALPPLQSCWWLEQRVWGQVAPPDVRFAGQPLTEIPEHGLHPALIRDGMATTAYSRAALHNGFMGEKDASYRNIGAGWILLAELDDFKRILDYYGRPSGDIVLAKLIDRLQRAFGDCVVRYANQQCIVFWQGKGGLDVAEAMRTTVETESFVLPEFEKSPTITISVGAVRFEQVGEGIERATAALADAKKAGGNCVRRS